MFSLLSKFGSLNFGFPRAITTRRRFAAPANLNSKALEELVGVPKPKRPVTGYLKFATEQRPTLVKENPSLSVPEIAKLTAEKWRATDDSLKKRYSLEYEEEKKKYQSALNAYSSALAKVNPSDIALLEEKMKKDRRLLQKVMERRTLRKRKAELGQPKKPVSPYLLFIQDRRSEQGSQPYKEWVAKMTEEWKKMTDSEKQPFIVRYTKAKEDHKTNMVQWAKRMCETGNSDVLPKSLLPSSSGSK